MYKTALEIYNTPSLIQKKKNPLKKNLDILIYNSGKQIVKPIIK